MGKLYSGDGPLAPKESGNSRKWRNVLVFPDSQVGGRDAPPRLYRGRLGNDQRRAAHSAATQVHEMPVVCETVLTGILAHR